MRRRPGFRSGSLFIYMNRYVRVRHGACSCRYSAAMTDPTWQLPPGEQPPPRPQSPYPPPYPQQPAMPYNGPYQQPVPYGQSPYGPPQQQVVVVQQPPTSSLAIVSLVLSILGLVTGCCSFGIPSIAAVIVGHMGVNDTKNGQKSGGGMAMAGLIMGYIVAAPAVLFSIWFLFFGGIAALSGTGASPTP